MSNYELQQYFFDMIKEFSISNPEKQIGKNFVYSQLTSFNISDDNEPAKDISDNFEYWMDRYENNSNIRVFEFQNKPFFVLDFFSASFSVRFQYLLDYLLQKKRSLISFSFNIHNYR